MNLGGWLCNATDVHGDIHVTPCDDLREHSLTPLCWCNPRRDRDDPEIVMHNAMDKRERYENEEVRPS